MCICTHTNSLLLISQSTGRKQMAHSKGLIEEHLIKGTVYRGTVSWKVTKQGFLKFQGPAEVGNITSPCRRGQDHGAVAMGQGSLHKITLYGGMELLKITAWQEGGLGAQWELVPWPLSPPTFWFRISACHQPEPIRNQRARDPGTMQAETENRSAGTYREWPANSLMKNI